MCIHSPTGILWFRLPTQLQHNLVGSAPMGVGIPQVMIASVTSS